MEMLYENPLMSELAGITYECTLGARTRMIPSALKQSLPCMLRHVHVSVISGSELYVEPGTRGS